MPILVILIQVVLPLLLLVWLAFWSVGNRLLFVLQVVAVAGALLGLTVASLWAMPPFWVPYLYLALFAVILIWLGLRRRSVASHPTAPGKTQLLLVIFALVPGLLGSYLFCMGMLSRIPPSAEVVETFDLAPPFPDGIYLIASGGTTVITNPHIGTLDTNVPRFRNWRGQSRALDIFKIRQSGLHVSGWFPEDPARYETFGAQLIAPCSGRVALINDGVPDNQVPIMNREQMTGNFVAIECAPDVFVILAHFQQNTVRVREGEVLEKGDPLGAMGNSGNSSEPHLHIHAQRGLPADAPLGGEPLALTINGRYLVRNDRLTVAP